jgi:hypothetical protein
MKHSLALGALALVVGFAASNASADTVASAQIIRLLSTKVVGTITKPAPPAGALANFQCSDVVLTAFSNEMTNPAPGDLLGNFKWTRTVKATGTLSSGKCSYSMRVPPGSPFTIQLGADLGNYNCQYIQLYHAGSGTITVPMATTKTKNFAVTSYNCGTIN